MRICVSIIALMVLSASKIALAQDVLLQPIDEKTLVQAIQKTPLVSPKQGELIGRAYTSGLVALAYKQYTLLWQKSPKDAYANLRRGQAAENYWHYATRPDINQMPLMSPQAQQLKQIAKSCLERALIERPNSISANSAYGYYLFWYGSQMTKGINLMKDAALLDPTSASAHVILGDAYAEHSGDAYNPKLAEKELKIAASLKPSDAFPHWRLVRVYLDTHQLQDAQRELQSYARLIPSGSPLTAGVKNYQAQIDKEVNNSR